MATKKICFTLQLWLCRVISVLAARLSHKKLHFLVHTLDHPLYNILIWRLILQSTLTRNLDVEMTPITKKKFLEFEPDDYQMEDGETRVYIDPKSLKGIIKRLAYVVDIKEPIFILLVSMVDIKCR